LPELVEGNEGSTQKETLNMPHMYILECADGSYYTVQAIRKNLCRSSPFIVRNMIALKMLFREKNKYKAGAAGKKQALIEGSKEKLNAYSRNYNQTSASTSSAKKKYRCPSLQKRFATWMSKEVMASNENQILQIALRISKMARSEPRQIARAMDRVL
jgi:hypothetical protein